MKRLLIAVFAVLMTGPAFAAGHFYLGGGLGSSHVDLSGADSTQAAEANCRDLVTEFGGSCSVSTEDNSAIGQFILGWQVNDYVGFELAGRDLGTYEREIRAVSALGETINETEDTYVIGLQVAAVGSMPLSQRVSLLGKVGFIDWRQKVDYRCTSNVGICNIDADETEDGIGTTFGLGVGFNLRNNLTLRVEAERMLDIGDKTTAWEEDIDVVAVNVLYRFR